MTISESEYRKLLANNPELGVIRDDGPAPALGELAAPGSPLAARFELLWRILNGPPLLQEHRFHPVRKWRFDYYHAPTRTAIELDGGVYSGGRHTRGRGFLGDIEKGNAAAAAGITVLRLGTGQVDRQHVAEIIDIIKGREDQP
jgi:very-short-patch-repair endonuclease